MATRRGPTQYDPHRKTWRTASWADRRAWLIDAGYGDDDRMPRWIVRNWSKLPLTVRAAVARVLDQRERQRPR